MLIEKPFAPNPKVTLENISQHSTSDASPTATPVMTTVTSTSSPHTTSQLVLPTIHLGNTSVPCNSGRGPPQTRCQAVVSQGARFKINRSATSQAVEQLLDVLDKVTKEMQCEENIEEADSGGSS